MRKTTIWLAVTAGLLAMPVAAYAGGLTSAQTAHVKKCIGYFNKHQWSVDAQEHAYFIFEAYGDEGEHYDPYVDVSTHGTCEIGLWADNTDSDGNRVAALVYNSGFHQYIPAKLTAAEKGGIENIGLANARANAGTGHMTYGFYGQQR